MPSYISPGVYIEEIEIGAKPIKGVSTDIVGFLGESEKGPLKYESIISLNDYYRKYGGYLKENRFLPYSVEGFFRNGGKRCYIRRVIPSKSNLLRSYEDGLNDLSAIDEISIIYSPNPHAIEGLVGALIEHCESMKDRFAIIDSPKDATPLDLASRNQYDTKYAAFYYPWLNVINPITNNIVTIPPGGHIAGIYARTDSERGVHKAPANEKVKGVLDLEYPITDREQGILNPIGVNCIRAFYRQDIRVWGARTLSSDPQWKYVNVCRLLIFIEESLEEGTKWVVFEPNSEKLWSRVKQMITQFLIGLWKDGALMGSIPEEAFFVKCDHDTMTQDDIDNGRLIVLIGVAPVKPAEFIIFRLTQRLGGSEITE